MKSSSIRIVSLVLAFSLSAQPSAAFTLSHPTQLASPPLKPTIHFEDQALSALAGTFRARMNQDAALRLFGVLAGAGLLAYGGAERTIESVFLIMASFIPSLKPDPYARDRAQREKFTSHSVFQRIKVIIWKDKQGEKHQRRLKSGFIDLSPETIDQLTQALLRPEIEAMKRGLLPKNHERFLRRLLRNPGPTGFLQRRIVGPFAARTPLSLASHDVDDSKQRIEGAVFTIFNDAQSPTDAEPTWELQSRAHMEENNGRKITAMWDIWFGGGGVLEIGEAMLDLSFHLALMKGVTHFWAFSNPRGLPLFWEKHPDDPRMPVEDYIARVIAPFLIERLRSRVENKRIVSRSQLESQIHVMTSQYVLGDQSMMFAQKIINGLREMDQNLHAPDLLTLIDTFAKPYDKGGFVIRDPAISTHLKRRAKIALIIPNAFRPILRGPGIGGGYAIIMEYSIPRWLIGLMKLGQGTGFAEERLRDRLHAFDILQRFNYQRILTRAA